MKMCFTVCVKESLNGRFLKFHQNFLCEPLEMTSVNEGRAGHANLELTWCHIQLGC